MSDTATVESKPKPAPSRPLPAGVERMAQCSVDPVMGGVSLSTLAFLRNNPECEALQLIDVECPGLPNGHGDRIPCADGATISVSRFFAPLTVCDACRAKADKAEKLDRAKTYWEALCPPAYRETDKTHPGFPKAQYEATRQYHGGESLFLAGPSGKGKTRLAVLLLKRCLVQFNQHVGILWPEQLKAVKNTREILQWVQQWGRYDLLLIDDGLLTAASDGRCTEAFKDLLDYRQRYNRHSIVTSQIVGEDAEEQSKKFGKDTKADRELLAALLRRLRETFRVVPFADVVPKAAQNEEAF